MDSLDNKTETEWSSTIVESVHTGDFDETEQFPRVEVDSAN